MREQDFLNQIEQSANDLPIPDSISPQNMKNMLEDYKHTKEPFNEEDSNSSNSSTSNTSHKQRYMKWGLTAACLTLCVIGGVYNTHLSRNGDSDTTSKPSADSTALFEWMVRLSDSF